MTHLRHLSRDIPRRGGFTRIRVLSDGWTAWKHVADIEYVIRTGEPTPGG